MKAASLTLCLALAGCAAPDGTPVVLDGTIIGTVRELSAPGSTYKAIHAADDAKCRNLGFKLGTEAYGNCRLQIEQIRATQDAAQAQQIAARRAEK